MKLTKAKKGGGRMSISLKKIKDTVFGVAIGDAFCAGIEFRGREWIRQNVDFTKLVVNRLSSWGPYTEWDYTDDTEMTLGLMNALMSGNPITEALLVKFWKDEYEQGKVAKGYGRGHGTIRHYYRGNKTIEEVRVMQMSKKYPGNAPPMRAVPLGLLPDIKSSRGISLINTYALINAGATHPHLKAWAASVNVARAAHYMIIEEGNPRAVIPHCLYHVCGIDDETEDLLEEIDKLPAPNQLTDEDYKVLCGPNPIKRKNGEEIVGLDSDAMRTAGCALYIAKHFRDAFSGLKFATYLGGDVDSIASIGAGILAGRYGIESLPVFMLEGVENRDYLHEIAEKFYDFLIGIEK